MGVDTTPPVITLIGDSTVTIQLGSAYTDAGATASDDVDLGITNSIVAVNTVNTATVGPYTVTYNVSDTAGNTATEITRIVNVVEAAPGSTPPSTEQSKTTDTVTTETTQPPNTTEPDTTPPVITLKGDNPVTVEVGSTYADAGATATDNVDLDLTSSIKVDESTVNTATPGSYKVTYNVSDKAGNAATKVTRVVEVIIIDTIPVVTLNSYLPDPTSDNIPSYSGSVLGIKDIVSIEYRVGGIDGIWMPVDSFTVGPNPDFTFTTPFLSDGLVTIQVRAFDAAGNVSELATDTLTIDT
ncbi:MAG: DUF5011 domain-containing protein, partial [Candidatus Hydromicrobium sp.]